MKAERDGDERSVIGRCGEDSQPDATKHPRVHQAMAKAEIAPLKKMRIAPPPGVAMGMLRAWVLRVTRVGKD